MFPQGLLDRVRAWLTALGRSRFDDRVWLEWNGESWQVIE